MARQELRNWEAELASAATEAAAAAPAAGGDFLGTRGGIITYKGAKVPNNELEVCILDFTNANLRYEGAYDEDNPSSPVCYAFGKDRKAMKPHEACSAPQHTDCESCPLNQWASAEKGKGKACQNTVRLAIVPAAALDNLANEEVAFLKVPVTSIKSFGALTQQYANALKRPPFAMTTIIRGDAGALKQPITFHPGQKIEDGDLLAAIVEKRAGIVVEFPFAPPTEAPPKPERKPNRFGRK